MSNINLDPILVFNLVTKEQRIAQLENQIEIWKQRQVAEAHSASAIRYYWELVMDAREELKRLKGEGYN